MLKGRSLKSCVALVVFSFSLVVACISPVWADTTSGDPDSFAVYAGYPTMDPVYQSSAAVVPFSGDHLFASFSPTSSTTSNTFVRISVPELIPVSYVRTFVFDVGFSGTSTITIDGYLGSQDVTYFTSSVNSKVLSGGCVGAFENGVSDLHGRSYIHYITIPAGCTGFETRSAVTWRIVGASEVGLVSYGGYVVASADRSIVDLVSNILSRVKSIDGNVSSSLTALNQILVQCQGIKADTSSISSILQIVSDNIVTLNGKVDDIYTLLKDSLAQESQTIDNKSQQVAGQIMQRVDAEQFWTDKNTENFDALDMGNWTFGDGVVGALPTVGNLFKSLWDSIGDATLIFVFPLMLGIALVIVGRLSRTAGKGSKKGGGDDG